VAALAALPGVVASADRVVVDLARVRDRDRFFGALPGFIERAGGRAAVARCGPVFTGPLNTQAVAYRLHLRQNQVGLRPRAPGTILDRRGTKLAGKRGFDAKLRGTEWILLSTC